MKKIIYLSLLILGIYMSGIVEKLPVIAATTYLYDNANLLSSYEAEYVDNYLLKVKSKTGLNIAVYTVTSLNGNDIQELAYDTYDSIYGTNSDGVLCFIAIDDHLLNITALGKGNQILADKELQNLLSIIKNSIGSKGDYYTAFIRYADEILNRCDSFENVSITSEKSTFKSNMLIAISICVVLLLILICLYIHLVDTEKQSLNHHTHEMYRNDKDLSTNTIQDTNNKNINNRSNIKMIKANDLQDYRPITSYQNGNEITLTSVKNAIKNCASEKGIPVAFENDQVKSGGLFNSEIEDCIIVYHPEHERDYFKFCIRVKHEGMYAFVIVQTFGRSSQMAKANREEFARADREGKSTSYKIGSMVSEKLFNIGKSKSKYENELMYYQCICDMFDEVIS